ncbi:MAG: hypothetical protein IBX45_10760 [Campylobacterales bacterium]|nr:hypothetical protein [Campylobacterales bacterium]
MKSAKGCVVMGAFLLLVSHQTVVANDCIDNLQNEMISIIYGGQMKGEPEEKITKKISRTFDQQCSEEEAKQKDAQMAVDAKDCIRNLELEMIRLVKEISAKGGVVDLDVITKEVRENFEGCKPANP